MKPANKDVQSTETPAGPDGQNSRPQSSKSLVFKPLVLNPTAQIPPPQALPSAHGHSQESDSQDDTRTPQRTYGRPPTMSRRFTYPDTYQESVWLLDYIIATREELCLSDHATDTLYESRSETEEDVRTGKILRKRTELEWCNSKHHETPRWDPGMDGADSEILTSAAKSLEDPRPLDVASQLCAWERRMTMLVRKIFQMPGTSASNRI
ncbi:hypothetical protein VUR80DRAFT_2887 [Thermomyces stellatus]